MPAVVLLFVSALAPPSIPLAAAAAAGGVVPVRPPSRAALNILLKKQRPKQRLRVARILGDSGGGRYPFLVEKHSRFSYHENVPDSDTEEAVGFYIGVAQRLPQGSWQLDPLLELDGTAALDQGKFSWNRARLKDCDGDRLTDLLLEYSYCGEANPGVGGGSCYRKLGIVNLNSPASLALNTTLDSIPGDRDSDSEESIPPIESTYQFVQAANGKIDLQVTIRYTGTHGKWSSRSKTVTYKYNPGEQTWDDSTDVSSKK